jgi:transposase
MFRQGDLNMSVAITRDDLSASELRRAAAGCDDSVQARRAPALALEGKKGRDAARSAGMDRQTLRDWVHRYNEAGLEGLRNRPNLRAPPRQLAAEQEQLVAEWARQGPDAERHKVVLWRLIDLRDEIAARFGVQLHERSVGKLLARLKFSHVSARPRHPEQDGSAQEAQKNFAALVAAVIPEHAQGKPIELCWQDEARVGQQGSLTYVWGEKGSRPRKPRDQRYKWTPILEPARMPQAGHDGMDAVAQSDLEHLQGRIERLGQADVECV